jgi:hypothetical protein
VVKVTLAMAGDGAVHATILVPCCLQLDGGSMPIATLLASAAVSTCASRLTRARCGIGFDAIGTHVAAAALGWEDSPA